MDTCDNALHISYIHNAAVLTATRASISTPVLLFVFTVLLIINWELSLLSMSIVIPQ